MLKLDKRKVEVAIARKCMQKKAFTDAGMPSLSYDRVVKGEDVRITTAGRFARLLGVDVAELLPDQDGKA